ANYKVKIGKISLIDRTSLDPIAVCP
ncbi:MAG: hypothetical protein RLZZ135_2202, partial [Cyanobacteriota bacterium]